ncbi:hypothetical protein FB45DRAFT_905761 [Roridomyces roridus]|uniref:Uncharacterized protein n=1 Tax=Roridomyces roridus TaxID=1738132 RepID=A0AAD7C5N8_9AGAR|nr:hypothetical protein FB45DRAFT_905761 [Roridomyces roridus]
MLLLHLALFYVLGLASAPLVAFLGPGVLKFALATLAGSTTVPNLFIILLVLKSYGLNVFVVVPVMFRLAMVVKRLNGIKRPSHGQQPPATLVLAAPRPRPASQASLLPVALILLHVMRAQILHQIASTSPTALNDEGCEDVPVASAEIPTTSTVNDKTFVLGTMGLVLWGFVLACLFIWIKSSSVLSFLLRSLQRTWTTMSSRSRRDTTMQLDSDDTDTTLVGDETEIKPAGSAFTGIPASLSTPLLLVALRQRWPLRPIIAAATNKVVLKTNLDPIVPAFVPVARPTTVKQEWVPTKPLSFQWSRGGCPTRITAPPPPIPLNANAPVFVPKVEDAKKPGLSESIWAPASTSTPVKEKKPRFRTAPPSFWAPGGKAIAIVPPPLA